MPLVVPGINDQGADPQTQWMTKLAGKKLGDNHNETTFAKGDLPKNSRVIEHGGMSTMDHQPDRMNVHLGQDGTVHKVTHG